MNRQLLVWVGDCQHFSVGPHDAWIICYARAQSVIMLKLGASVFQCSNSFFVLLFDDICICDKSTHCTCKTLQLGNKVFSGAHLSLTDCILSRDFSDSMVVRLEWIDLKNSFWNSMTRFLTFYAIFQQRCFLVYIFAIWPLKMDSFIIRS